MTNTIMLLAIDIGNSNIVFGVFEEKKLKKTWRIETKKDKPLDFYKEELSSKQLHAESVVIGSVVPELDGIFDQISNDLYNINPLFVSTELHTGITNLSNKKTELGADRLSDIVAAICLYPDNRIIVDLGTATKFEAVSDLGEYKGGAIGPGIGTSFTSLIKAASKLSDVQLSPPKKVVGGFVTTEHLNSGFIYGFAGMIDGMIFRIKEEMGWNNPSIIITGGFTDLIAPHLRTRATINKDLTLIGLRLLWEKNK